MRRFRYADSRYVDNGDLRDALAELVSELDARPDDSDACPTLPPVELMQSDGELPRV